MVSTAAPDIRALTDSLTVSRIDLSSVGGVAVDVTFTVSLVGLATLILWSPFNPATLFFLIQSA